MWSLKLCECLRTVTQFKTVSEPVRRRVIIQLASVVLDSGVMQAIIYLSIYRGVQVTFARILICESVSLQQKNHLGLG